MSKIINKKEKKNIKKYFLYQLKKKLINTSKNIGVACLDFFTNKKIDVNFFNEIEEKLLYSDVGIQTTQEILKKLKYYVNLNQIKSTTFLYEKIKNELEKILLNVEKSFFLNNEKFSIVLLVGVNGVGKTTTIGKLGYRIKKKGRSILLAAGDTFRVAAIDQLLLWSKTIDVPIVYGKIGSDPGSVVFDSILEMKKKNINTLLIDTAGRLQNKIYLIDELKKIVRIVEKQNFIFSFEKILILDANTGQNAINQVEVFHKQLGLTGIILTKLDGTSKGGVIFSIANRFRIPIYFIGIGENKEDLRQFIATEFIRALFNDE
ncbi:MAG: signal recognition particle-docking protein FtsY [Arsenophonus sp.]|nr:MAG: signal recognition particle-docking protein FtsY [Arsenophonus sp.]